VIIPHGIFDPQQNLGRINLGLSRDTSEFACDSLRWFWNRIGQRRYPGATSILVLCDGGGSNSATKCCLRKGCDNRLIPNPRNQKFCQHPACNRELRRWTNLKRQQKRRLNPDVKTREADAQKQRRMRKNSGCPDSRRSCS
jgi:hypothetical protein